MIEDYLLAMVVCRILRFTSFMCGYSKSTFCKHNNLIYNIDANELDDFNASFNIIFLKVKYNIMKPLVVIIK